MKLCVAQLVGRTRQEGKCHLKSQIVQVLGLPIMVGTQHPYTQYCCFLELCPQPNTLIPLHTLPYILNHLSSSRVFSLL